MRENDHLIEDLRKLIEESMKDDIHHELDEKFMKMFDEAHGSAADDKRMKDLIKRGREQLPWIPFSLPLYFGRDGVKGDMQRVINVAFELWKDGGFNEEIDIRPEHHFKRNIKEKAYVTLATVGSIMKDFVLVNEGKTFRLKFEQLDNQHLWQPGCRVKSIEIKKDKTFKNVYSTPFEIVLEVATSLPNTVETIQKQGFLFVSGEADYEFGEISNFEVDGLGYTYHRLAGAERSRIVLEGKATLPMPLPEEDEDFDDGDVDVFDNAIIDDLIRNFPDDDEDN